MFSMEWFVPESSRRIRLVDPYNVYVWQKVWLSYISFICRFQNSKIVFYFWTYNNLTTDFVPSRNIQILIFFVVASFKALFHGITYVMGLGTRKDHTIVGETYIFSSCKKSVECHVWINVPQTNPQLTIVIKNPLAHGVRVRIYHQCFLKQLQHWIKCALRG